MGSEARIVVFADDEAAAARAAAQAFDRVAHIESVLTDYRPDSEAMRLGARPAGRAVPVSDDLAQALSRALDMAARTDGRFDPTVGPFVRLWRHARSSGRLPGAGELEAARRAVGHRLVTLGPGTATLARGGMALDFGGIGKGWACDQALDVLESLGMTRALVEIGGDLVVGDPPPGADGWRVDVEGYGVVLVANQAICTSGDAERFVEIDGVRYSHIVDPATGLGLTGRVSVTTVAPDGWIADALASALSVAGPAGAAALLERAEPAASAFLRDAAGRELATEGFPPPGADPDAPPRGWTTLFNGRDLDGWQGLAANVRVRDDLSDAELASRRAAADARMRAHWSARDGVLVFDGGGDSLVTRRDFADFELLLDWKIAEGGDSGVYLRGVPQVQIWDNPEGSGALWNNRVNGGNVPLEVADHPPGTWNRFWIRMDGRRVWVRLNGALVVDGVELENYWDRSEPVPASGPIELQAHGSALWFRRVFVLEPDSAVD